MPAGCCIDPECFLRNSGRRRNVCFDITQGASIQSMRARIQLIHSAKYVCVLYDWHLPRCRQTAKINSNLTLIASALSKSTPEHSNGSDSLHTRRSRTTSPIDRAARDFTAKHRCQSISQSVGYWRVTCPTAGASRSAGRVTIVGRGTGH